LNQLGQWFNVRKAYKQRLKLVLFNLLETYFLFLRSYFEKFLGYYKQCLLDRIPEVYRDEVGMGLDNELGKNLLPNFISSELINEIKRARVEYEESIKSLAQIDPILAYYLNGKTDIFERFDKIQLNSITPEGVGQAALTLNSIKPELVNETIEELRNDVKKVAWKVNPIVWMKARIALKRLDRNSDESIKEKINSLIDKLQVIPNTEQ
jgi:hypothetical protein